MSVYPFVKATGTLPDGTFLFVQAGYSGNGVFGGFVSAKNKRSGWGLGNLIDGAGDPYNPNSPDSRIDSDDEFAVVSTRALYQKPGDRNHGKSALLEVTVTGGALGYVVTVDNEILHMGGGSASVVWTKTEATRPPSTLSIS